jgi:hypothetical protein
MPWNPKAGPNPQHPPASGAHGQDKPSNHGGGHGQGSQVVHRSLHGEQKPDKSPRGKRTY